MRTYIGDMRRRMGVEAGDASRDAEIEKMTPEQRLELLCGWHFGDPNWASSFINWARDAGFKVSHSRARR